MGVYVQCVVNFADNLQEDGGTLLVPLIHRHLKQFEERHRDLFKPLPWLSLPPHLQEAYAPYAHRACMREVWCVCVL